MMASLRNRLIISHILPLLIVVPLIALSVFYVLETQLVIDSISESLTQQARMVSLATQNQPGIWQDENAARLFLTHYATLGVALFDREGHLIASTTQMTQLQAFELRRQEMLQNSTESVTIHYDNRQASQIVEVMLPVRNADEQPIGFVRVNQQLASLSERFRDLRILIIAVVIGELVLGILVGLLLALRLEVSFNRVTEAISQVATGQQTGPVKEEGPKEIRQMLHAFNLMVARLQAAQTGRKQLLANLVHELGRPLGAMRSAIRALLSGGDTDPAFRQELLMGIDAHLQSLEPLLNNLAQLHIQIVGAPDLRYQELLLSTWLPQVIGPWRAVASEKYITWETRIPELPVSFSADPDRLSQALGNLLSNAVKYTPEGGKIRIEAEATEEQLVIIVADSGPGISTEEQAKVFEPFYRSQAHRRFPQGMGLGLTIARDLITAHGGKLSVESSLEQGTSFKITLPLASQYRLIKPV